MQPAEHPVLERTNTRRAAGQLFFQILARDLGNDGAVAANIRGERAEIIFRLHNRFQLVNAYAVRSLMGQTPGVRDLANVV